MAVQLFKRTKQLELKVDEILDLVSQSAMTFDQAIDSYLSEGIGAAFNRRLDQMVALESRGDKLGLAVELQMYSETLIPDARGDVLTLLRAGATAGAQWAFARYEAIRERLPENRNPTKCGIFHRSQRSKPGRISAFQPL